MEPLNLHTASIIAVVNARCLTACSQPGYEGHLNDRVVSLAEALRDGGYHTYLARKWHLGHEPEYFPHARGFEGSFSMLFGGASNSRRRGVVHDERALHRTE